MNAAAIVFIALGLTVTFVIARKHIRIWRRTRKVAKVVKLLQQGKQPVTVADVAARLEEPGVPFTVSMNPLPEEHLVGEVVSARIVGENSNGQYEIVLPCGQAGYLSWYDVSDEQFEALNLGDCVQARIVGFQDRVVILSASPVPVIPTD